MQIDFARAAFANGGGFDHDLRRSGQNRRHSQIFARPNAPPPSRDLRDSRLLLSESYSPGVLRKRAISGRASRGFARMPLANSGLFDHLDADCGQNCRHSQSMVRRPCLPSKVLRLRTGKSCAFALTLGRPALSRRQRRLSQSRGSAFPEIEKARSELLASSFKWCG